MVAESLRLKPLCEMDAIIKAFIKNERMCDCETLKPPRLIQGRSTRYTLEAGCRLKPLEEWLWGPHAGVLRPYFAKSMNSLAKGRRIFRLGNDPDTVMLGSDLVYILCDYSRFDSTQNDALCEAKDSVYRRIYPADRILDRMLRWRHTNRCYTRSGIYYTCERRCMSGDYDTALGNCLINYMAIISWAEIAGIQIDFIIDGDDSVICCRRSDLDRLLAVQDEHFAKLGLILKSSVVSHLSDVDFCQGKVVNTIAGPRLVREPWRAIKHSSVSIKKYTGKSWRAWLRAVGECELATNKGVPIMQSFGKCLIRNAGKVNALTERDLMMRKSGERVGTLEITDEARKDFALCFGVNPTMQRHWEAKFDSLDLDMEAITRLLDAAPPTKEMGSDWLAKF